MIAPVPSSTCPIPTTYRSSQQAARIRFAGLLKAEWIALLSIRQTYMFALIGGILATGISTFSAHSWSTAPSPPPVIVFPAQGFLFAQISAALIGAALYAREEQTGSLRTQFAAAPRRVSITFAKAAALALPSFVLGVILYAISLFSAGLIYILAHREISGALGELLVAAIGGGAVLAFTSALGLGIALITRSEALTLTIILALIVIAPTLLALTGAEQAWSKIASEAMFANAASALLAAADVSVNDLWRSVLVAAAWPGVALAAGAWLVAKRDA